MKKLLLVVLVLVCCSGCSIAKEYIEADDAYWKAITPEYLELVKAAKNPDGTPRFTQEEQDRRERTVKTWRLMIDKGAAK